jgi:predicted secreted protein
VSHISLENPASGAVVDLAVGDTLEVRVRQIGGTGYQWSVVEVPTVLSAGGEARVTGEAASGMPGAASDVVFEFATAASGSGVLTLALARVWESAPIETIEIVVRAVA